MWCAAIEYSIYMENKLNNFHSINSYVSINKITIWYVYIYIFYIASNKLISQSRGVMCELSGIIVSKYPQSDRNW